MKYNIYTLDAYISKHKIYTFENLIVIKVPYIICFENCTYFVFTSLPVVLHALKRLYSINILEVNHYFKVLYVMITFCIFICYSFGFIFIYIILILIYIIYFLSFFTFLLFNI